MFIGFDGKAHRWAKHDSAIWKTSRWLRRLFGKSQETDRQLALLGP